MRDMSEKQNQQYQQNNVPSTNNYNNNYNNNLDTRNTMGAPPINGGNYAYPLSFN